MTLSLLGIGLTGAAAFASQSRPDWKASVSATLSEWSESLGLSGSKNGDFSHLVTDVAEAKPFVISVQVAGHVDSSGNATLSSLVEGSTTIISIVPEGTAVKTGQVVCELDSSALREKFTLQEIKSNQADAAAVTADKALDILKRQNETDIEAVKLKLRLADLDLDKYENGEYPKLVKQLSGNVAIADEELLRIRESYEFTKLQVKKGARTQNDLEAERIAVKQSELKLDAAMEELKVLKEFDYNRTIAELKANAQEFKRELERTNIKCEAALVQANQDFKSKSLIAQSERAQLEKCSKQIEACTIRAPQDGEVVYANLSSNSRGGSSSEAITEGAQVRERQAIINLPDVTRMKVDCRIHESQIAPVRPDLPVRIRIEAFPDTQFNGVVTEVSSVPMSGRWPQQDLREYETEIKLTDHIDLLKTLRPGLTAQVEILVDSRDEVLQVPVQSIVSTGGRAFTFVLTETGPERRDLTIGQSNQSHIEIKSGLRPGEKVVLNPRSRFAPEIALVEAEVAQALGKSISDLKVPAEGAAGDGQGSPKGKPGGTGGSKPDVPKSSPGDRRPPKERFAEMDLDKDGVLTAAELTGPMKDKLSEMDKDGNGSVSEAEFIENDARFVKSKRPQGPGQSAPL